MENKSNFKITPLKISLLILLLVAVILLGLQLIGLRRQRTVSVPPQAIKEEVLMPITPDKFAIEEKPAIALSPPLPAGVRFTIQVASFQDKARAEIVAEELRKKGYMPTISYKDLDEKGIWYRVCVGDFESQEKAKESLEKLKEHYKDSFIKLK